jgi:hypothetical protein
MKPDDYGRRRRRALGVSSAIPAVLEDGAIRCVRTHFASDDLRQAIDAALKE